MCRLNFFACGLIVAAFAGCSESPPVRSAATAPPTIAPGVQVTDDGVQDETDGPTEPAGTRVLNDGESRETKSKSDDTREGTSGTHEARTAFIDENLAHEIEITGKWTGFSSFFWDTNVYIERNQEGLNSYNIKFEKRTDLTEADVERSAIFKDGILTMDSPVSHLEMKNFKKAYKVLFVVRTARGDFLIPAANALAMQRVEDLNPGLVYRRYTE